MDTVKRTAAATWKGSLEDGEGSVSRTTSGQGSEPLTWEARVGQPGGRTSPEELIAAAHAGCYSMALAHVLDEQGIHPDHLDVTATCDLELGQDGPRIAAIELEVHGRIPGLEAAAFEEASRRAEATCPVSNALRGNLEIRVRSVLETT